MELLTKICGVARIQQSSQMLRVLWQRQAAQICTPKKCGQVFKLVKKLSIQIVLERVDPNPFVQVITSQEDVFPKR